VILPSGLPWQNSIQKEEYNISHFRMDLNLGKKLVNYHIWNKALYGAGT
jgi:hypothetical protein